MSEAAVRDFFPFTSHIVQRFLPWLWARIFPSDSPSSCPVPVWNVAVHVGHHSTTALTRWPFLAAACVFGMAYGKPIPLEALLQTFHTHAPSEIPPNDLTRQALHIPSLSSVWSSRGPQHLPATALHLRYTSHR